MLALMNERALVAIALFLTGGALLATTFGGSPDLPPAFDPTFFPRIVLILWVALAAMEIASAIRRSTPSDKPAVWRIGALVVAVVLYAVFFTRLGFFITSVAFCTVSLLALGQRHIVTIAAFAIGTPAVLLILFNRVLKMPLPASPFVWWL
ncbi:MAG: tripartite tricarboxylate transporter TctB family protein [Salinarimonas sp.]